MLSDEKNHETVLHNGRINILLREWTVDSDTTGARKLISQFEERCKAIRTIIHLQKGYSILIGEFSASSKSTVNFHSLRDVGAGLFRQTIFPGNCLPPLGISMWDKAQHIIGVLSGVPQSIHIYIPWDLSQISISVAHQDDLAALVKKPGFAKML